MNTNTAIVANVVDSFIAQAKGDIAQTKLAIGVTTALKDAFIACKTTGEFLALFGTGGNNKLPTFVQGEIDLAFRAKLAKQVPAVQKKALSHFKSEMSNCRKVKALGLTLTDGKGARAVLNDHRKANATAPAVITTTPEQPASTDWTMLGKNATMEDVANFVSSYVAHHGLTATRALAAQLKDFMPITVQRAKQAA